MRVILLNFLILVALLLPSRHAEAADYLIVDNASRNEISVAAGVAFGSEGYRLAGAGFQASLPHSATTTFDGRVRFRPKGALWELVGQYRHRSTSFTGLPALTPQDVSLKRQTLSLLFGFRPFRFSNSRWFEALAFHFGYGYRGNRVDVTAPNAVLLPYDSLGAVGDFTWQFSVADSWAIELRGEVYLPHVFRELGGSSGAHRSGVATEAAVGVSYELNPSLQLGAGVRFLYEGQSYSGTGSRGVSDAVESYTGWNFPLEVRYAF